MARMARVVLPDYPHHITQRGNWRQNVFREAEDYLLYLDLLQKYSRHYEMGIAGYCLMTNHVHVVAEPYLEESIANTFKYCHGTYATSFNKKYGKSGHLWKGRPYSCVLDEAHAWATLRYVERNPVRAGMVACAEDYRWSSARTHCGMVEDSLLNSKWPAQGIPEDWSFQLGQEQKTEDVKRIRDCTYRGRPCGSEAFVRSAEAITGRRLTPAKFGPRPQQTEEGASTLPWSDDGIQL